MNLADRDPWLEPYRGVLYRRDQFLESVLAEIGDPLGEISQGHHRFGLHKTSTGWRHREWAPGAYEVYLTGDFNGWDRRALPLTRDEFGVWTIESSAPIAHGQKYALCVVSAAGEMDRIPAYANWVVQDPETRGFAARVWDPKAPFTPTHPSPKRPETLRIYEAHVGMAVEDGRVGTYREFAENLIPRIAAHGYNTVQLMAIQEHPYYGSFGYHVSNFFAPSSRFGDPDDLRRLVDAAHAHGLTVLLDLVHSHSVKNVLEGLFLLDGTDYQYFHAGPRGVHQAWDSMLFDYSKPEVRRFLLSNARYWLEEFGFDGYRFDGITSILYKDHGLGAAFENYDAYFGANVDDEALTYLRLANTVIHRARPEAITIAEDVSGMPGIARPIEESGLGFDYRLAMGVPDYWFRLVEKEPDEAWNLAGIYGMLLNRRRDEKHVAYVESHDQALVGDKTLAFWLMDAEMYTQMATDRESVVIDRGIALHKMLRLLTFSLGGEAYLNFMGNEFGHPEWIDFPREGNGYSYHYARRQWSLADNGFLRYKGLNEFDKAMLALDERFKLLGEPLVENLMVHEDTRQLAYRRGPLVFIANFHAHESFVGLQVPVPEAVSEYEWVLDTDQKSFGGFGRVDPATGYAVKPWRMYGQEQSIEVYLPSRSILVLAPKRS